jgi:hypothetical protein
MATRPMAGSLAAVFAATHEPLPSAPTRAIPLVRPAGLAPVAMNPKKALPCASMVTGVLMMTTLS